METVWIVDDSALATNLARSALASAFACETFAEGTSVLERLSLGAPPNVLLVDWELPDISGVDLCRSIRERYDDLALPILLVTGRIDSAALIEGLQAGANDYVRKPYVPDELLARVQSVARAQRLWRRNVTVESQLATTLRSIGEAVLSTDAQQRVVFMNAAAEELTGWSAAEAAGRPFAEVCRLVEAANAAATGPIAVALRDRAIVGPAAHATLVRRDGVDVPIDHGAAPIIDYAGAVTGAVLVFRDVGHRKQAEAERERMLAELGMRADFERQLIGIVSHDLRNPLTTIRFAVDTLLDDGGLDAGSAKTLVRARTATHQSLRMVSDLLDFTQARLGGGLPIVRSSCDLHAVVHQVVEDVAATRPDLTIEVSTSGRGLGRWDLDRMTQVVANLVGNAVKHGARLAPILVRSDADDTGVTVSVHNQGRPIEPDALERIFHPMQRATDRLDNTARSVGLGLFIVKHIVEAHGGSVAVESSDGGTSFSFRVPR